MQYHEDLYGAFLPVEEGSDSQEYIENSTGAPFTDTQKDTGEKTDQKDTGEKTDQKDTGEKTDQKDTGEKTDQKDTGEKTDQGGGLAGKSLSGALTEEERLKLAAPSLIYWFQANKRSLPWRSDPTPYHVWLSEIMLQQTRVEAVIPYYYRFLERLPEITDLAEVPDEELMKLWQGLGYYNRARNLKKAAQAAVGLYDGNLPGSYEELLAMPGIGPYTAGAVASIAMNLPEPAVDGNVLRVISRLWASEDDISLPAVRKKMEGMIRDLLKEHAVPDQNTGSESVSASRASVRDRSGHRNPSLIRPAVYNQALMELGALVCIPNGAPHCEECPWEGICLAHKNDLTDRIPYKAPKKARKIEQLTVFLIRFQNQVYLRKRPAKGLLANLYELPNVKGWVSLDEAIGAAEKILACKNCRMEVKPLKDGKHIFTHVEWQMKGYEIIVDSDAAGLTDSKVMEEEPADAGERGAFYTIPYIKEHLAIPSAFSCFSL